MTVGEARELVQAVLAITESLSMDDECPALYAAELGSVIEVGKVELRCGPGLPSPQFSIGRDYHVFVDGEPYARGLGLIKSLVISPILPNEPVTIAITHLPEMRQA